MNKKILSIGIIVTAIWIVIILSIFLFTSLDHPKSLNEFGDFLAGVFAPIAFFWLILGYMQQGKQLEQNTKALEQQEIALQLQIDEMKENVKQQKEIALINEKTLQASYEKERPYISYYAPSAFKHSDDHYVLVLNVYNMGKGDCYNLQATLIDGLSERPFLNFLKVRAATAISLSSFKHSFLEEYDEYLSGFNEGFSSSFNDYTGVIITAKILINYENIYNQKFEEILEIKFPLKQDFDKMLRNYKFDRE